MKIAIVDTCKIYGSRSINKDLNGGYGTHDYFGDSIFARIFEKFRGNAVFLPHITSVYVSTILKQKGHEVEFYFDRKPEKYYDIFIMVGSIVDQKNENILAGELKEKYVGSNIGFIGTFPATMPKLYSNANFIIDGEPEAFFLYEFDNNKTLEGIIKVNKWINMNDLPSPDYSGFPFKSYRYKPILNHMPMLSIQSSRGCPYSCGYYCTYPTSQGKKVRQRSPKLLVEDIINMKKQFGVKSLLFRDPIFGIDKKYPYLLSNEIIKKKVSIYWGIETRADLLSKKNLFAMYKAGLRSVNIGIETNNLEIAKQNKRKLSEANYQNEIIQYCNYLGIKVVGFFIIGMEGDTISSVKNMVRYAIKQNIFIARFSVSTPYPGTKYYDYLDEKKLLLNKNYDSYNQFTQVVNQDSLKSEDVERLVKDAYKYYYIRGEKIYSLLYDQIQSLVKE